MRDHLSSVWPRDYRRVKGEDVLRLNIMVATRISEIIKPMLGPKGMNKMLTAANEKPVITNDAKTFLDAMNLSHPIVNAFVSIAKNQEVEVGDGTKITVIFAGQLLKNAEKLLDQRIPPTTIIRGYNEATKKALTILDKIGTNVSINDEETFKKIAKTALAETTLRKNCLVDFIVFAVKKVVEVKDGRRIVNVDYVDIKGKSGGNVSDSKLVRGLIIHKVRPQILMPKKIERAKIALFDCSIAPLTRNATKWSKEFIVKNPQQLQSLNQMEKNYSKSLVKKMKGAGVKAVFSRKTISDSMLRCLASEGILALYLVSEQDMTRLARAVCAKIVSNINDLKNEDLGEAGLIEFRKIADDEMLFIEHCKRPKAFTIFVRGGTEQIVEEVKKKVKKSVRATATVIEGEKAVPGGGAIEIELARALREFSKIFRGKEKLAIIAFADALITIAETLAINSGLNKVDALTELKAKHAQGATSFGVDVLRREILDTFNYGILDASRVKENAIKLGNEIATIILRIDDVISIEKHGKAAQESEWKQKERRRIQTEKLRRFFKGEGEIERIEKELKERKAFE